MIRGTGNWEEEKAKKNLKPCSNYKSNKDDDSCKNCGHTATSHKMREEFIEKDPDNTRFVIEGYIYKELNCTEDLTLEFIKQTIKNIRLFDNEQKDYGSRNISRFGEQGILVRSSDKFERLVSLRKKNTKDTAKEWGETTDEAIEDTWQYISNYATMAIMVRAGVWPKY